jgi:hypothetical protein
MITFELDPMQTAIILYIVQENTVWMKVLSFRGAQLDCMITVEVDPSVVQENMVRKVLDFRGAQHESLFHV